MASTYIFIDTTLIGHPKIKPWVDKCHGRKWVAALYDRNAITVSPILIDIESVIIGNHIDTMMGLVNAIRPQLGISFIDTELSLNNLQKHLRQFIYIKTSDGKEHTLRLADCAVLPSLEKFLSREQWGSIVEPFETWRIHGRDGRIKILSTGKVGIKSAAPLTLNKEQIDSITDTMRADQLLANLRRTQFSDHKDYSMPKSIDIAWEVLRVWQKSGRVEDKDLLVFARHVFNTDGRLLSRPGLLPALQSSDSFESYMANINNIGGD